MPGGKLRHRRIARTVAGAFCEAGLLAHDRLRSVLALWRAPERLATSPACRRDGVHVTDVLAFGETGAVPVRRGNDGWSRSSTRTRGGAARRGRRRASGRTLTQRGRHVGCVARWCHVIRFRPTMRRGLPAARRVGRHRLRLPGRCWQRRLTLTSPPGGLVDVGGYRFVQRELQSVIGETIGGASFAALPHALLNHRLAGYAADRAAASCGAGGRWPQRVDCRSISGSAAPCDGRRH